MVDATAFASEQDGEDASTRPRRTGSPGRLGGIVNILKRFLSGRVSLANAPGGDTGNTVAEFVRDHADDDRPLQDAERSMLLNLLKFRSVRVEDVMVPRANVIAVEADTSFPDLVKVFREAGHSRLPLYRTTLDDPIGMIHIKDVMACFGAGDGAEDKASRACVVAPLSLSKLVRKVLFVPASMPAADLLVQMQTERIHMALVIDEYGGTDGLVTIEDLVETIVGDIEDEHDTDDGMECLALDGGGFQADARIEIVDFEDMTKLKLGLADTETEEVDTLGGLVFTLAGRVPRRGEIIRHPGGYDFEIVEADPRRIRRLRVLPRAALPGDATPAVAPKNSSKAPSS